MSKLYDALRKLESERTVSAGAVPRALDTVRLEQFLDLQSDLVRTARDAAAFAERLAHRITVVLGVAGAAIGVVHDGRYRLLGAYGAGRALFADDDGARAGETPFAVALAGGRPLVLPPADLGLLARRIVLPFEATAAGVVQLLVAPDAALSPDDVALARVIAIVTGLAIADVTRRRRPVSSRNETAAP
jgi:hypothetical protein